MFLPWFASPDLWPSFSGYETAAKRKQQISHAAIELPQQDAEDNQDMSIDGACKSVSLGRHLLDPIIQDFVIIVSESIFGIVGDGNGRVVFRVVCSEIGPLLPGDEGALVFEVVQQPEP